MDPLLVLLVAGVVLLAELPDKSMFASLVLGTRFRPQWVFLGVAAAFVVHVVIAVTAGSLLRLAPPLIVDSIVTVLFLAGAAYLWWHRHDDAEDDPAGDDADRDREPAEPAARADRHGGSGPSAAGAGSTTMTRAPGRAALTAFGTSFGVIFIGEWGDITQILTANLAARYHDTWSVALGAVLGLLVAALLAITVGRTLLKHVSVGLLHRIGAVVLLGFAIYGVVNLARS